MHIKYKRILHEMEKYAEVEYRLLLSSIGPRTVPTPDMIEIFSYKCDAPWFRTEDFRYLLIQYRNEYYKHILDDEKEARARASRKRKREKEKARIKRKCVRKKKVNDVVLK